MNVVAAMDPGLQEIRRLEKSVSAILGPRVEFRLTPVPEIQPDANGKFRVSRSFVKSAYDGIDWNTL
jgi:hypothetical protein